MFLGSITFINPNDGGYPYAAGVLISCPGGGVSTPTYKASYLYGTRIKGAGFRVTPGNTVTATADWQMNRFTLTVDDVTKNKTASTTGLNSVSFAEHFLWGVDTITSSGTTEPIPTFTAVNFTNGSVNGQTVQASGAQPYDLAIGGTTIDIHTGTLNATGDGWQEIWEANS